VSEEAAWAQRKLPDHRSQVVRSHGATLVLGRNGSQALRHRFKTRFRRRGLKKATVAAAVDGDGFAIWVAKDAKAPLLEPDGAGKAKVVRGVHEQEILVAFAITGGVVAVANVEDELTEGEGGLGRAFQDLIGAHDDYDRGQVRIQGMRFDARQDDAAMDDGGSRVGKLREIAMSGENPALRPATGC